MRYLRQNTAVIVTVGPFFDKTDGVTLETALTITNERISFVVDGDAGSAPTLVLDNVTGATSGTSNDLNYIADCDAGLMQIELSQANTNYVGRAILTITDAANHCPVFHEFTILPANVYDSLILGTDLLDANASQLGGTSQTGRDVGASVLLSSGTGTGQISLSSGAVLLQATQTGVTIPTVTALTNAPSDSSGVTELLTRIPDATAGSTGGLLIAGSNAATTFASLTCTGALTVSDGVIVTASTTNRNGISATGNGTGHGINAVGGTGTTSAGLYSSSAATTGFGILGSGTTVGIAALGVSAGISGTAGGGSDGSGIAGYGDGTGAGLLLDGGTSGYGLDADSLRVSGTTTLTGAVSLGSTLGVTGTTTLAALSVTGQLDAGNVLVDSTVVVTTNCTVSGNLLITGTTTHTGAITATNASNDILGVDVRKWLGTVVPAPNVSGVPLVDMAYLDGTASQVMPNAVLEGTVDTTAFAATTTEFESDDITTAAADHYNGRVIVFTSGTLQYQACTITDYSLVSGRAHFTVSTLTSAPANDVTFAIY